MKALITAISLSLMTLSALASQELPEAFRTGDVETIASHLGSTVEIFHLNDINSYSKEEASTFLTQFFGQNDPQAYEIVHEGSSRGAAKYTIGKLTTAGGTYRIYVYFEEKEDRTTIRELRIDRKV